MEDYRGSLTDAASDPALADSSYDEMAASVYARGIYYGDSYLAAFRSIGWDAEQVVPMCRPLQYQWGREHGLRIPAPILAERPLRWWWTRRGRMQPKDEILRTVLAEQVRVTQPDVLWVFSGVPITADDIDAWAPFVGTKVLWWSCAVEETVPFDRFDLVLSASRPLVEYFRGLGRRSELLPHAFDPRVLERVSTNQERSPRAAFVGSLGPAHGDRSAILHTLSRTIPIDFYGPGIEETPDDSPLRRSARAAAWGDDLYRVYAQHSLVVHANPDFAAASAKRLFEATGMAACVLAPSHADLTTVFQPGVEVVTYRSADEATSLAVELLGDVARARSIANAGHQRTMTDHTYRSRVVRFREIVEDVASTSLTPG